MAFFTEYVILRDELDVVTFKPGDEVPEWAIGQVGDHCMRGALSDLVAETDAESEGMPPKPVTDDASTDAAADDGKPFGPQPKAEAGALDFTGAPEPKPAARKRAPRKSTK